MWPASRDLLKFWHPLGISEIGKVKNVKFVVRIVGQNGRGLDHVTYFYNFGTPCISLEWVKPETSNLAC